MDSWYRFFTPIPLIGLIHIGNGIIVLISPNAINVSAMSGMVLFGVNYIIAGYLFIAVGIMALLAHRDMRWAIGQQALLTVQFIGIVVSLWNGYYPDGYVPVRGDYWESFWFILEDQWALMLLCLSHSLGFMYDHAYYLTQRQFQSQIEEKQDEVNRLKDKLGWLNFTKGL